MYTNYCMDFLKIALVTLLLLLLVNVGTGFLLTGKPCIASSPCDCYSNYVSCSDQSLTSVPKFTTTQYMDYTNYFSVYLYNNHISTIHNQAFKNLSSIQSPELYFYLYNNSINRIDENAFAGIESNTNRIDLSYNDLTTIPTAFSKLTNLEELIVRENPMKTLDSSVMSHLGRSLTTLYIDMQSFQTWPISLSLLSQLKYLYAFYIPFNHVPYNAFDGMSSTLTSLTISKSKLYRIPPAVCHLHKLETLNFDDNAFLETNISIFEPCNHQLKQLTKLSLQDNRLTAFPNVLYNITSLTTLNLHNNNISFIPSSAIPYNSSLNKLYLGTNDLTRIPHAINRLDNLQQVFLSNNMIVTIQDNDFTDLASLRYLYLGDNPIAYVSPNAFKPLGNLWMLVLDNSRLTSIPEAVLYLPKLGHISFRENDVKCSCALSYLRGWNVTNKSVYGNCNKQANDPLQRYIETSLPNCP